ncbi:MAG TPA: helix-turn-helix transcriptional regulator [Gaiellaceae bacterium]|nr:helix-turn-helix transcriptional regulator [Gaiellaceae bacterium]HZT52836.1 helix-turn-helix transcriptional regulator [Gaiellaceae bacterium]
MDEAARESVDPGHLTGYREVAAALFEPPRPSPRELELLELMADGLTDVEIAERLSISAKTMRSRLHALRMKMHARTRTHAVAIAFRRGLLDTERRRGGDAGQSAR